MQGLKIRVPDVPAYLAMPRACGANTTPIAFAEVYLALQNGTVEAQENPLTTIEAKKFYEVQKHIILTGHIVDHLNTVISKTLWSSLSTKTRRSSPRSCRKPPSAPPRRSRSAKTAWWPTSRKRA
jgi:TRAP-type C4-dicarboxylate transport system substrate-binding protein